jgi:hypothetical protein
MLWRAIMERQLPMARSPFDRKVSARYSGQEQRGWSSWSVSAIG